jgi:hypothetical protein
MVLGKASGLSLGGLASLGDMAGWRVRVGFRYGNSIGPGFD